VLIPVWRAIRALAPIVVVPAGGIGHCPFVIKKDLPVAERDGIGRL
jgi:hypothetical protein